MAITDRNLALGTRLVAKYKKQAYSCAVVQTDDGVRFRLEDGRTFKSPSAAGSAVMGGSACNGWAFWSLAPVGERGHGTEASRQEGDGEAEQPPGATQGAQEAKKGRAARIIKRVPNQQGTPEGQTRWFCSACGDSFFADAGAAPDFCPKGHRAELDANGDLVTEPPVIDEAPAE